MPGADWSSHIARPVSFALATSIAFGLLASDVRAVENLPSVSLRALTANSKAIVVATPVEAERGKVPKRFRVLEVFSGADVRVDQEITLFDEVRFAPREVFEVGPDGIHRPGIVAKALLFRYDRNPNDPPEAFRPYLSGYRILTGSGEVLEPVQLVPSGPYVFVSRGTKWGEMIDSLRRDVPIVDETRRILAIERPENLNSDAIGWMREHRRDLRLGWEHPDSWGGIPRHLAWRIMQSCRPEASWEALELTEYVEPSSDSAFCSVIGRRRLLTGTLDETLSPSLRLLALKQLSNEWNHWRPKASVPGSIATSPEEQREILSGISPLLEHQNSQWRYDAMSVVQSVSIPAPTFADRKTNAASERLVERYRRERDGHVRWYIVDTLRKIEDDAFWQKLTGNPSRLAVFLTHTSRDTRHTATQTFELNWSTVPKTPEEKPLGFDGPVKLRFERPHARGVVVHTREVPMKMRRTGAPASPFGSSPEPTGPPQWFFEVQVPPGPWCMTAEGDLDGGKLGRWRSEPEELWIADQVTDD